MPLSVDKGQLGMSAAEKLQMLKKQLLEKANRETAVYPLSYGQKALYFLYLSNPESFAYNVSFSARIVSALNAGALRKALQRIVNRDSALRTNFKLDDGKPVQLVHGYKELSFEVNDVSGLDEEGIRNLVIGKSRQLFDLEKGDVFRAFLFSKGPDDNILLLNMHHIVTDARSIEIIADELGKLYQSEVSGSNETFLPNEKHYHDFIKQQSEFVRTEKASSQLDYWKNEISADGGELELPFDFVRPASQTYNGDTVYFELEKSMADKIRQVSKETNSTMFAVMLACYMLFLKKYTTSEEIVAGVATAGRTFPGFENLIGYFINPVAIKAEVNGSETFSDLLSSVKKKVLYAIDSQDLPFQYIVEKLIHTRDPSRSPVFQTFFGLQRIHGEAPVQELIVPGNDSAVISWAGLTVRPYQISQQEGQFDLTAEFAEGKEVFSGAFKYNTDLFRRPTVERMAVHFTNLLEQITSNPQKKIREYRLITDDEKEQLLSYANETARNLEIDFIDTLFRKAAAEHPDSTAVEFEGSKMSYLELNILSDKLASLLSSRNIGPGSYVAICHERSTAMVAAMLAVLKTGAAYVPVDPEYPEERIRHMLGDCRSAMLITQRKFEKYKALAQNVFYSEDMPALPDETPAAVVSGRSLSDAAYVIYTSGSTGLPKGTVIPHSALANHMLWMQDYTGFCGTDSVLQKTSYSFDASVWEFYLPLLNGGRLVMAKPDGHMDTDYLARLVKNSGITHIQFVPSLLNLFIDEPAVSECTSLRFVFSGGEALTGALRDKVFAKLNARLVNLYGPTEVTIDSVYFECGRDERSVRVPIGKPVYNTKAYVVDADLNLLPQGLPGELLLGGAQVAGGYLNNPGLTSERFITDHIESTGTKLYRTGDKVRLRADGILEYLGRTDHQVKFRGFRIELGEIESALKVHDLVRDAYVDLRKDPNGRDVLSAYVISDNTEDDISATLISHLRNSLPGYMVPGHFTYMRSFPFLPNGKIDRRKLPEPEAAAKSGKPEERAVTPAEKTLVNIWKEVLGVNSVGIHDNFFELGGDSIMSIQIISRAAKEGLSLTPRMIFTYQTISGLAKEAGSTARAAYEGSSAGEFPLAPIQARFMQKNMKNPSLFSHSLILKTGKNLDVDKLSEALKLVISWHPELNMKVTGNGTFIITPEINSPGFAEFDYSGYDTAGAQSAMAYEKKRLAQTIDIHSGRIVRSAYFRLPGENDALLFLIHHICIDGVSWRIFTDEFAGAYSQLTEGSQPEAPRATTPYGVWSRQIAGIADEQESIRKFDLWKDVSDAGDQLFDKHSSNIYGSVSRHEIVLDEHITSLLTGSGTGNSTYELLLTAVSVAYAKVFGKRSVTLDLEGHGRDEIIPGLDVSNTVGWFTSLFPVTFELSDPDDLSSSLNSVRSTLEKFRADSVYYGIGRYVSGRIGKCDPAIVFNYLGRFNSEAGPAGWKMAADSLNLEAGENESRQHFIEINSMMIDSRLHINIDYVKEVCPDFVSQEFPERIEAELKKLTGLSSGAANARAFSDSGLDQRELDDLLSNIK